MRALPARRAPSARAPHRVNDEVLGAVDVKRPPVDAFAVEEDAAEDRERDEVAAPRRRRRRREARARRAEGGGRDGEGELAHDELRGETTLAVVCGLEHHPPHELRPPLQRDRDGYTPCLLYTSPSPRDGLLSRMPSSA